MIRPNAIQHKIKNLKFSKKKWPINEPLNYKYLLNFIYGIINFLYYALIKTGFLPNGKRSPFHQLPVIEVDDKIIGQTGAIARYCGKVSNRITNRHVITFSRSKFGGL